MNKILIKKLYKAIFLYSLFSVLISCSEKKEYQALSEVEELEQLYSNQLKVVIYELEKVQANAASDNNKEHFWKARKAFKTIESIVAFLDYDNYNYLNQANILKVDEEDATAIKIKNPVGFQVLEELLYDENFNSNEFETIKAKTLQRLKFIEKNKSFTFLKSHHILWMIRDGFLRTSLLGITSFDVPEDTKTLEEALWTIEGLKQIIEIYEPNFSDKELYSNWTQKIDKIKLNLENNQFETFDYFNYYKNDVFPLLQLWKQTVTDWNVKFSIPQAINYEAENLFTPTTFNTSFFLDQFNYKKDEKEIALGKLLFEDKNLSNESKMSCATCHQKELYFTDGFAKSPNTNRNSPTLLYAALQKGFFHDKRTGSLEGQIIDVVENPNEFHSSLNHLEEKVKKNIQYVAAFEEVYKNEISNELIRKAMASYIASLSYFNSKFDKSMQTQEEILTQDEQKGFSIFMGKAKCATCHFAPIFNGTVPVAYKESEIELIGVPETNDTINAKIDSDLGRYEVFKTNERKFFFKTPTVRNVEKTGPYMHNGVFKTLEEVVDFYDRGGGHGLGIELEYQTLPTDKLNLTKKEKAQLVSFLKTLTDEL